MTDFLSCPFKGHFGVVPLLSNFQDEYEELLRYAVVTPKYELSLPSQLNLSTTQLSSSQHTTKRDTPAQPSAGRLLIEWTPC